MLWGDQCLADTVLIKCLQGLLARFDLLLRAGPEARLDSFQLPYNLLGLDINSFLNREGLAVLGVYGCL